MFDRRPAILVLSTILGLLFLLSSSDGGPLPNGAGEGARGPSQNSHVDVFYATNRERDGNTSAAVGFGGERGEPSFGRCEVMFKPIPMMDMVAPALPFYVPSETNRVRVSEQTDQDAFWARVLAEAGRTRSGSVVLFIHGYNYGFDRTCRMAAELARDLDGGALLIMFSWPANGLATDYVSDQADLEWSVPFLAGFIAQAGDRIGPDRVQLLAHSLGSRGLIFALQRLRADRGEAPVIGKLVLLAPDFDTQVFVELLPRLRPMTGGITLYASGNDTPLKVSRQLSGYPRLGEGAEYLTLAEGMETIDVTSIGLYQLFGHEYFFYHPQVVSDLVELLIGGRPASERSGLLKRERDGLVYWEIEK